MGGEVRSGGDFIDLRHFGVSRGRVRVVGDTFKNLGVWRTPRAKLM